MQYESQCEPRGSFLDQSAFTSSDASDHSPSIRSRLLACPATPFQSRYYHACTGTVEQAHHR